MLTPCLTNPFPPMGETEVIAKFPLNATLVKKKKLLRLLLGHTRQIQEQSSWNLSRLYHTIHIHTILKHDKKNV